MSERTINGKSIAKVLEELQAPFPRECIEYNKYNYPYIKAEFYHERLDEVVGIMNYDFIITHNTWVNIKEDVMVINCVGTLSLKDDNGVVVASKSAEGTDVITMSKGKVVKPGNDAKDAQQDAFKSCCRMMGIGDKQVREARKKVNDNTAGVVDEAGKENGDQIYVVKINGPFSTFYNKKREFVGYKVPVMDTDTKERYQLVIYADSGVKEIEKTVPMKQFVEVYTYGTKLKVGGYYQKLNNGEKQIVMKSVERRAS